MMSFAKTRYLSGMASGSCHTKQVGRQDTTVLQSVSDTLPAIRQFSMEQADSIFRAADLKQKQLDSIFAKKKPVRDPGPVDPEPEPIKKEQLPYHLTEQSGELNTPEIFLRDLKKELFSFRDTQKTVYIDEASGKDDVITSHSESTGIGDPVMNHAPQPPNPDWLLGVIILLLVLMAWLKLFYNKFFDHTLKSVFNYQLSAKVLRDQNIFSRRVAFVLNINFILTSGLFLFLASRYFSFRLFTENEFLWYLMLCGLVSALVFARFVIMHLTGFLFDKKPVFNEYLNQILLIYKSLGVYLLPLVIFLAYLDFDMKIYVIYLGMTGFLLAYLLRLFKGLQTILKKDVLIFYLILYLCTLEFLPIIVSYRFFTSFL